MPELPEVETIRYDLQSVIIRKKIVKVVIYKDKIVRNDSKWFSGFLKGKEFKSIDRIGKLLIFVINQNNYLLIHLRMTGQLIYQAKDKILAGGHSLTAKGSVKDKIGGDLPNKYTHVAITFGNNSQLFFNDLRQFGYLQIVDDGELEKVKKRFGIEPLRDNFSEAELRLRIKSKKTNIKNVLLNQQIIAGIGNIYADEILFAAGVSPMRRANSLSTKEIGRIFGEANRVIAKAIQNRGTTFSNYVDASGNKGSHVKFLKVYGRKGQKCYRCGTEISKIKLAGRGTHYCKVCQK